MSPETDKLCELVSSLRNHDIEKMSESDALTFKANAMARFRVSTACLPELLLGCSVPLERFVWHVEAAEPYCLEWIGRFSLRATGRMEANLGQPRLIAMAAAMWPSVELIVDLMGDYHYAGGLSVEPELLIRVRVDEVASEALEKLSPSICEQIETLARCSGVELCVRTVENAMDDQVNPPRLQDALKAARSAASKAAEIEGRGESEALEIQIKLSSEPGIIQQRIPEALASMGSLFAHCNSVASSV